MSAGVTYITQSLIPFRPPSLTKPSKIDSTNSTKIVLTPWKTSWVKCLIGKTTKCISISRTSTRSSKMTVQTRSGNIVVLFSQSVRQNFNHVFSIASDSQKNRHLRAHQGNRNDDRTSINSILPSMRLSSWWDGGIWGGIGLGDFTGSDIAFKTPSTDIHNDRVPLVLHDEIPLKTDNLERNNSSGEGEAGVKVEDRAEDKVDDTMGDTMEEKAWHLIVMTSRNELMRCWYTAAVFVLAIWEWLKSNKNMSAGFNLLIRFWCASVTPNSRSPRPARTRRK